MKSPWNQVCSRLISFLLLTFFVIGCAQTPTGRKQLAFMPKGQMAQMGDQSFAEMQKSQKVSHDKRLNRKIKCISERIVTALGESDFSEWEVKVFEDKAVNAFALPGKNIGVFTGLIEAAQNNGQIASVIGHEVGHVIAEHGNERVSQNLMVQGGLVAADIALDTGGSPQKRQLIMGALGLGAQLGVLLPYSRKHESEADQIGLELMAKAGFDPKEAVEFWKIMGKQSGGAQPPEILSTHPANQSRIKNLEDSMEGSKRIYAKNKADWQACP